MALPKDGETKTTDVDDGITMKEFGEEEFKAMPEVEAPPEEMEGKPFPSEHAARLKSPGLYKRFRRQNDKFGAGVDAIWGVRKDNDKVELQAIRFDVKKFTVAQAKKWLKEHDHKPMLFEPATGKTDGAPAEADDSTDVEDKKTDAVKQATYHRFLVDARLTLGKADDGTGNGWIEGYASQFDVIDHQGEIVRKGAFTKTIAEQSSKLPFMAVHFAYGGDIIDCVGVVARMKEDDYGLWFHADFLPDEKSQEIREKVVGLRGMNVNVGTSIGYRRVKNSIIEDNGQRILEHTELALGEITGTIKPANEGALVTDAKSDDALMTAIRAVAGSETEALDGEKSRLLEQLGGREKAEELATQMEGVVGKIRDLLADAKPRDTDDVAGSTDDEPTASTSKPVDLHSARAKVEEMRRELVLIEQHA